MQEKLFPWQWNWAWSPQIHYPLSGAVKQDIDPTVTNIPASAGNKNVEMDAVSVASYGRQLGLISEVLLDMAQEGENLSPKARESLGRLKKIQEDIEQIKLAHAKTMAQQIVDQMERLKDLNMAEFAQLGARMQPMLTQMAAKETPKPIAAKRK